MKKSIWAILSLSLMAVAMTSNSGPLVESSSSEGAWYGWAELRDECGPHQICAEWIQADSSNDGTFCCISQNDMFSTSFDSCARALNIRPSGGNPL